MSLPAATATSAAPTACPPRFRSLVAAACALGVAASAFPVAAVAGKPRPAKPRKTVSRVVNHGAHVRVETARLRPAPGENQHTVALLDAGRTARVVGRKNGWLRIKLATGTVGWVRSDLLKVSKRAKPAPKAPKAVAVAAARPSKPFQATTKRAKTVSAAAALAAKAARVKKQQAWAKAHAQNVALRRQKWQQKLQQKQQWAAQARARRLEKIAAAQAKARAAKQNRLAALAAKAARQKKKVAAKAKPATTAARLPIVTQRFWSRGSVAVTAAAVPAAPAAPPAPTSLDPDAQSPVQTAEAEALTPNNFAEPEAGALVEPSQNEPLVLAPEPTTESAVVAAVNAAAAAESAPAAATADPPRLPTRGERLVRTALTYRGTPYRFGARGNGAFDCSGFTSYLFNNAGAGIPRTAAQQYKYAPVVPKSQLRPGDLVFFKNTYKRGVSHVGIYIGNNQFVHAANRRRGVRVDNLSGRFYVNHWAGARRPMP